MPKFEILEHTADVRLKILGVDSLELFKNGVLALANYLADGKLLAAKSKAEKSLAFAVSNNHPAILLVDFLNEALFAMQVEKQIVADVVFEDFKTNQLTGRFLFSKARIKKDIKAVTYHNLKIFRNKDRVLEANIVLDI